MAARFLIAVGLVVAVSAWVRLQPFAEEVPVLQPLAEFPATLGAWQGEEERFEDYVYEQLRVTDSLLRHYRRPDGASLHLYVGYYASQREGMQIHSPRHCLPGGGWRPQWERDREIRDPRLPGGELTARETLYAKGQGKTLFLYWYQMADRFTTSEYALKLFMVDHAIRYNRTDAAFVRLSMPVGDQGAEAAAVALGGFAALCVPELVAFLPR